MEKKTEEEIHREREGVGCWSKYNEGSPFNKEERSDTPIKDMWTKKILAKKCSRLKIGEEKKIFLKKFFLTTSFNQRFSDFFFPSPPRQFFSQHFFSTNSFLLYYSIFIVMHLCCRRVVLKVNFIAKFFLWCISIYL